MKYRLDMNGAFLAGAVGHPQHVILAHFPDAGNFVPKPLGDCWDFEAGSRDGYPDYFSVTPEGRHNPNEDRY